MSFDLDEAAFRASVAYDRVRAERAALAEALRGALPGPHRAWLESRARRLRRIACDRWCAWVRAARAARDPRDRAGKDVAVG